MVIKDIKTSLSGFEIFSLFKDRVHCFFLDSAMNPEKLGRYSFIGFEPEITFKSKDGIVEIKGKNHDGLLKANPFDELKTLMKCYNADYVAELPFIGGAVGYLGYDMCHHIEKLPRSATDDIHIPDCFFGIYDCIIAVDHLKEKVYAVSPEVLGDSKARINNIERIITSKTPILPSANVTVTESKIKLSSNLAKKDYIRSVERIKGYIEAGDIYQVNMTQRFVCRSNYSPFELYSRLRKINPAPFACYMDFGCGFIISSSPESFLQIRNRRVQTRPIKGTRPRGKTPQEDKANSNELLESEKDKAELLMIVDLERNDLGKVCKTGSVIVTELFQLEEYPTVYHLTATVKGELKEDKCAIDCITALFPGGSITGAPKIRAMEIIDELEPTQRNIYTGVIGYIGFNNDADFNIVIRTVIQKNDKTFFQVGGGIVWDSDAQKEYEECLDKAKALIIALNAEI